MSSLRLIIVLASFATLGCVARHRVSPPAPQSVETTSQPAKPTDCAVDEKQYSQKVGLISNSPLSIQIERQFQNVIHQDCSGAVIKSGIETVQSPTKTVEYQPATGVGRVGAVRLFNETACDWSTAVLKEKLGHLPLTDRLRGTIDGKLEITVDASKGLTSLHVMPGVNKVDYTYYTQCVPDSERHTTLFESCTATEELSSGSFIINVDYAEKTLPGDKIVTDCKPEATGPGEAR
jgi:hypothetical protein